MRIFITGATDLVGRELIPALIRHGHDVIGMARTEAARAMLQAMRATPLSTQGRNVDELAEVLAGTQAIIHLATTIPTTDSAVEDEWRPSSEVVKGMLRYLIEASASSGVRTLVFPSFCGVYGNYGDACITEDTPPNPEPSNQYYLEAEQMLLRATYDRRVAGVTLRMGLIYGADSPRTRGLLYALRKGQATYTGEGDVIWPLIHVADAATAIRLAAEQSPAGRVFNICDDHPVTQFELYSELARMVGGPPPQPATPIIPGTGPLRFQRLDHSVRMTNWKAKRVLGFKLAYPTFREGYSAVLAELATRGQG
ncbi:MAG: hypothetical protein Kow00124_11180 [Anaerolineae bacterium]